MMVAASPGSALTAKKTSVRTAHRVTTNETLWVSK